MAPSHYVGQMRLKSIFEVIWKDNSPNNNNPNNFDYYMGNWTWLLHRQKHSLNHHHKSSAVYNSPSSSSFVLN